MFFNVKSSTYFPMKMKILADFHICISVPLFKKRFWFSWRLLSFQPRPSQIACTVPPSINVLVNGVTCTMLIENTIENYLLHAHTDYCTLKNHYHSVFNFQYTSPESLQPQYNILYLSNPYLKFHVRLIDLSQSDIQILTGLQICNGIRQCVSST